MTKKDIEVADTRDETDGPAPWPEQVDSGAESVEIQLPDGSTGEWELTDQQRTEAKQGELLVEEAEADADLVDEDDVDETV